MARDFGYAPQSEVRFEGVAESVTAGGVGNEQRLLIQANLPRNFAHALVDASIILKGADAGSLNFGASAVGFFQNAASPTIQYAMELTSTNVAVTGSAINERRVYTPKAYPTVVMKPNTGADNNTANFQIFNATQNDVAIEVSFFFRFLQFTINQADQVGVNAMLPVR